MGGKGRPFVFYVAGLALALILPAFIFSMVVASQWVASEKERLETSLRNANEDAVAQVDLFLTRIIALLQALGTSPALDRGDFARFDQQAREVGEWQKIVISLRDRSGRIRVNTQVPAGQALPAADRAIDRAVIDGGQPLVTDEIVGASSGEKIIIVNVPIVRGGEVAFVVSALLTRTALAEVVRQASSDASAFVSLTVADRAGIVLAGTGPRPAGERLPEHLRNERLKGRWTGLDADGVPAVISVARSAVSGWIVTASIDKDVMEASLHRSEWSLAALSLFLTAVALGAALIATRKMVLAHQHVAQAAKYLGFGMPFRAPHTAIREVNLIGHEIAAAGDRLREQASALAAANNELERRVEMRTQELARKTELLQVTLDNMDQGLMMIDPGGAVAVCNRRAGELLELPEIDDADPQSPGERRFKADERDFISQDGAFQDGAEHPASGQYAYERETPSGAIIEVRTVPLADGSAVRTFTDITAHKTSERQARHMARHDPLTDLPNRTLFRERLNQHLAEFRRHGGGLAVLSLDLDRFKIVNDTLGHPAGDALLREVAARIKSMLRVEDTVARLGGDEFAIIQVGGTQPWAASGLCDRLMDTIGRPITLDGHQVSVGASVGIAVADPEPLDGDQLFKNSDRALYRAKSEGRNAFRFYQPDMELATDLRRQLEADLRLALQRQEFHLHFQPMLHLASGRIEGLEALLRWQHPTRGSVPPGDFITVAEETGLIVPIGEWVLREACREAATWPGDLVIAVNISAIQCADGLFVHHVTSALAAARLPAHRLELEVTETVLMNDGVGAALHHLRRLGVRIALDDFGTGYSSLSYLRRFPVDKIKIDRSFIQELSEPGTAVIVRAIVGLGAQLGTTVTAEGVETQEQFDHVTAEGCTEVQGFLISHPLCAMDAHRLIATTRPVLRAGAA